MDSLDQIDKQGKVAVITGGTAGIGLAAAKLFATEGAHVFVTGRRKKQIEDAVKEIRESAFSIQGVVADLADLDRLYELSGRRDGSISSLHASLQSWTRAQMTPHHPPERPT